jgi:hypothetical protein
MASWHMVRTMYSSIATHLHIVGPATVESPIEFDMEYDII